MVLLVLPKVPAGETGLPYAAGMRPPLRCWQRPNAFTLKMLVEMFFYLVTRYNMYFWYPRPKTGMVSIYRIVGLKHWTFSYHMCISHVESQGSPQGATCYWGLSLTAWSQLCLASAAQTCQSDRVIYMRTTPSDVISVAPRKYAAWLVLCDALSGSDMAGYPGPVWLAAGRIPGPWSIGLLVALDLLSTLLQALCTATSCNFLSFWITIRGTTYTFILQILFHAR